MELMRNFMDMESRFKHIQDKMTELIIMYHNFRSALDAVGEPPNISEEPTGNYE